MPSTRPAIWNRSRLARAVVTDWWTLIHVGSRLPVEDGLLSVDAVNATSKLEQVAA
ncbi:hypothetical protein ACUZ9P_06200 [Desulfovibrio sp. QI0430]